jgi:hypothetical protein
MNSLRTFVYSIRYGQEKKLAQVASSRWLTVIVLVIISLGALFRVYDIANLYLDSHAERQAQVAMVARNLQLGDLNWWCPRLDIFGPGESCHLLEFPFIHSIAAALYMVFGESAVIGRMLAVVFSVASIGFLYGIARYHLSSFGIIVALSIYSFAPFSVYFGRTFMAEPTMMFFSLGALYFVMKYFERRAGYFYALAVVCGALTLLVKPTGAVILLPILAVWVMSDGFAGLRRLDLLGFMSLSIAPLAAWTIYSSITPNQGLPDSWNLFYVVFQRDSIIAMLVDHRFYTQVGGALIVGYLTPLGAALAFIGIFRAYHRDGTSMMIYFWVIGAVVYLIVLAGPNTGHVYYQLPILPLGCLLAGLGAESVLRSKQYHRLISVRAGFVSLLCMCAVAITVYGYMYVRLASYLYDTERRMPYAEQVSEAVKERIAVDEWFIINQPGASTSVVTYLANRDSISIRFDGGSDDINAFERLRNKGAALFVAVDTSYGSGTEETQANQAFWYHLNEYYELVEVQSGYMVFEIRERS